MKCPICEQGTMQAADDILFELDERYFVVAGKRCDNCGEEVVGEKEGQRFITLAKKIGVWGDQLKLHRKLSKSGRGTVLRIPTDIEHALKLKGDEDVRISRVGKNKILIEVD